MQEMTGDGAATVCVSIPGGNAIQEAHDGGGGFLYEMRLFSEKPRTRRGAGRR